MAKGGGLQVSVALWSTRGRRLASQSKRTSSALFQGILLVVLSYLGVNRILDIAWLTETAGSGQRRYSSRVKPNGEWSLWEHLAYPDRSVAVRASKNRKDPQCRPRRREHIQSHALERNHRPQVATTSRSPPSKPRVGDPGILQTRRQRGFSAASNWLWAYPAKVAVPSGGILEAIDIVGHVVQRQLSCRVDVLLAPLRLTRVNSNQVARPHVSRVLLPQGARDRRELVEALAIQRRHERGNRAAGSDAGELDGMMQHARRSPRVAQVLEGHETRP